jgi:integrase/recombinase XerD
MLEKLFTEPAVIRRHENAPYREERERYLEHCWQQGYSRATLRVVEGELLWVARKLRLDAGISLAQVKKAARGWTEREEYVERTLNTRWTRDRFIRVARSWLRFLGYWREPSKPMPFALFVEDYRTWMERERGFTPATIERRCGYLGQFLLWYGDDRSFFEVCLKDVDTFLASCGARGNCRESVRNMAAALRAFFTYAGSKGWCAPSIAFEIHGPRLFSQEHLPQGPSWQDVGRLLAHMETDRPSDIRDKVITMLFAIYGFRATEVAMLKLEDIDWEQSLLSVVRVKRRGRQAYPLTSTVGDALIRYLREVRPRSSLREIFLTLVPPFRPISRGGLYSRISKRMRRLGISAPHLGPHSLRHACAAHLLAERFSLKEIGDHLGHRSAKTTRIYAKVDLPGLREVAAFDLGGLS